MSNLAETEIYSLLPPNLQDSRSKALSTAISAEFVPFIEHIKKVMIYANVSNLDENICDQLALIFDVHAYSQSFDIETKRDLIQNAIIVCLYRGTAIAVQKVISAVHGGATLDEWFNYGGDPFMFKIIVDTNRRGISINDYDKLIDNINAYQSARSVLEEITVNLKAQGQATFGSTAVTGDITKISPEVPEQINSQGSIILGSSEVSGESGRVLPDISNDIKVQGLLTAGSAEKSGESAVVFPDVEKTVTSKSSLCMACFLKIGERAKITS